MKARIKKSASDTREIHLSSDGPYHGHPIRLSIGMIVKNEEKTLDRCLSSLKPLMEAVESELIITDTGSTDSTVEIAKKYTDHIIHFEWCDDFSAARNTGLKEARGEWFLFLDGDEWFENTDELIEFFTSGECDKYGSASYVVRNYADYYGKIYTDYHAFRVSKVYKGIHFQKAIHEDITRMIPTKFLNDYVHHYGYAYHSKYAKLMKFNRNIKLMESEIERNSYDLKMYYQISRQYFGVKNLDKAKEYCEIGLRLEKEHPNYVWRLLISYNYMQILFELKDYQKLLAIVKELFAMGPKKEILCFDFYYYAQAAAFYLKQYDESIMYGQAYLQLYELNETNGLDKTMLLFVTPDFIDCRAKEQVLRLLAQTYLNLNDISRVEEIINQLDCSELDRVSSLFLFICRFCSKTNKWTRLSEFYQKARSNENLAKEISVPKGMEIALESNDDQNNFALRELAKITNPDDPYVRLCRLRVSDYESSHETVLNELNWFFRWNGEWDPVFSDVLFYAMKENINIMPLILKIDFDNVDYFCSKLQNQHEDFADVVCKYLESFSFENAKGLHWSINLREHVLLAGLDAFASDEDEIQFFVEYAWQRAKYVRALYRPEHLTHDRVSVLPRAQRFGYYIGCAFSARDKAQYAEYLFNLRLALQTYPLMKRQISLLLEQFEKEEKLRMEKADEFRKLAVQVKEQIRKLIALGNLEKAGQYTVQLAALLPNDPDVVKFRSITHTEPDMNELAARLPQ